MSDRLISHFSQHATLYKLKKQTTLWEWKYGRVLYPCKLISLKYIKLKFVYFLGVACHFIISLNLPQITVCVEKENFMVFCYHYIWQSSLGHILLPCSDQLNYN